MYATPSPEPNHHLVEIQKLQELVHTLEAQNQDLRQQVSVSVVSAIPENDEAKVRLEEQNAAALQRASELEAALRTSEKSSIEKQSKIESLERLVNEVREDVTKARSEGDTRVKEVKTQLEESETLVTSLKGLMDAKASAASENDANLAAKQAEIDVLRAQVARVTNDLEQERKELGSHVDELRRAGQVSSSDSYVLVYTDGLAIGNNCPVRRAYQWFRGRAIRYRSFGSVFGGKIEAGVSSSITRRIVQASINSCSD